MNANSLATKIVEQGKSLPDSSLWKLQENIFKTLGLDAWTKKGVPSYMTSNPFTASRYANLVLGYLRDCISHSAKTPINIKEPIYIFDLGAGTGRFAFVFLKKLFRLIKSLPQFENLTIRYVLTDIVTANLEFCKNHQYLKPLFDQGILDIAYYKHDQTDPIHLQISNITLDPDKVINPIILIGNYFFDTIPQDLLKFNNGTWEEGLVNIKVPQSLDTSHDIYNDPNILEKVQVEFEYKPIDITQRFKDEIFNLEPILDEYAAKLQNVPFTLPLGAFKAINYFDTLSNGRFLLIAGDQGYVSIEQLKHSNEPRLAVHGSFSMGVNYHAIALYLKRKGGMPLITRHADPLFIVFCAIMGDGNESFPETLLAHREQIDDFEPKDYWNFATSLQEDMEPPNLDTILLLIKLGCCDPMNFHAFYNAIREQLPQATAKQKNALRDAMHETWDEFYPIHPQEGEFIMNLGVLFFEMQHFAEALGFLQRALMITGENPTIYTNMAACYLSLFNPDAAHKCFEKAKDLFERTGTQPGNHTRK